MAGERTHIGHVKGRASGYLVLHPQAETVDGRHFAVPRGAKNVTQHAGWGLRRRRQLVEITCAYRDRLFYGGIVEHGIENQVALSAVVGHAEPAAEYRFLLPEQIIGKAEPRFGHNSPIIPAAGWDLPVLGEAHAIEWVAALGGIDVAVGSDCDSIRRVVGGWIEKRNLVVGVILRWGPHKAHAVIERQSGSRLPGVLNVELKLIVAELPHRPRTRLEESIEVP